MTIPLVATLVRDANECHSDFRQPITEDSWPRLATDPLYFMKRPAFYSDPQTSGWLVTSGHQPRTLWFPLLGTVSYAPRSTLIAPKVKEMGYGHVSPRLNVMKVSTLPLVHFIFPRIPFPIHLG